MQIEDEGLNRPTKGESGSVDIPYLTMSSLLEVKKTKKIASLQQFNFESQLACEVDQIPNTLALHGVRSLISTDLETVFKDAKS